MSRRDEKDLREGAIKKIAEMPISMIENMASSKLCWDETVSARDVIGQSGKFPKPTHCGGTTSVSRGSTIGYVRSSKESCGNHSLLATILRPVEGIVSIKGAFCQHAL